MSILWQNIIIDNKAFGALKKIYERNIFPSCLIFFGPEGVGKEAHAFAFAQSINCLSNSFIPCGQCVNCHYVKNFIQPYVYFIYPVPGSTKTLSSKNLSRIVENFLEKKK